MVKALGMAALPLVFALGCAHSIASPVTERTWSQLNAEERGQRLQNEVGEKVRKIRVGRAEIAFLEFGKHKDVVRAPLLMIHGIGANMGDMAPLILKAMKEEHVIAIDLPGYGQSKQFDHDFTIARYAWTIRQFVRRLGHQQVRPVCHSLGGHICVALTLAYPRLVQSLVLIDSAGTYDKRKFVQSIAKGFAKMNLGQVDTRLNFLRADNIFVQRLMAGNTGLLSALASFSENLRHRLPEIQTPTLIVWGRDDPVFSVEEGAYLKEAIIGSEMYVIPGARHLPHFSHTDLVADLIRKFHAENKT